MKAIDAIQCDCSMNPDIDGYYDRAVLEEQCEYLGQPAENWMSHLFGHIFADYSDWNKELETAFMNDSLQKMTVDLNGDIVTIKKIY